MVKFKSSIGSTNGTTSQFLVNDDIKATEPRTDNYLSADSIYMLDDLYDKATKGNIYLDDIMVSTANASIPKGIDASHLSKICRIDIDSAKQTLEVTSQHSTRSDNPTLTCNFRTSDRMLGYKRIKENFFMETVFSKKTVGKSSLVNMCCQICVLDKGFVYAVPMKSKLEVLQAVNKFAKEIGAPDAIISDAVGEKTSKALRN